MSGVRLSFAVALLLLVMGLFSAGAWGFATIAPPPQSSGASGLPDGRVYELVSPANKHGYQAGATGVKAESPGQVFAEFSVSSPDGDAVVFGSLGPAGEENSGGLSQNFVAERKDNRWVTRSSTGRGLGSNDIIGLYAQQPLWRVYSPDLMHLAYNKNEREVVGAPMEGGGNTYLLGSNPLEEPTWLLRGLVGSGVEANETEIVGMSPDASVVYFAFAGQLLAQDASRSGPGIYEYRDGAVTEAGVLPDGSVPAGGALPVATATVAITGHVNNPASLDNQVSEDGMRLFFVSGGEVYVHEIEADGGERTVLVSGSRLAGHVGEPAPDGAILFENRTQNVGSPDRPPVPSAPTYGYATPDGSHVFFQSIDQLTAQAPTGAEPKVYDFDVDSGSLEYLPGVAIGGIVTAARDGSSFAFVNVASSPQELDLWSAGLGGGSVTQIAQLPGGGFVGPGRLAGGTLVFQASAPIPGFNNVGGEQVYRYDTSGGRLGCVSCPPAGINPSGSAYLSVDDQYGNSLRSGPGPLEVNDARGVSSDGNRIFFDSPDPVVGRDTNGVLDAYEWENGTVFLLSSGTNPEYSLFLDNSETGGDVFLATADGLVQGDTDAGFDVYDVRIPRPGDNPPPLAVPCSGDVCQGPPSVTELLGAPPSATFNGTGNLPEPLAGKAKSTPRRVSRAQKLAVALRVCRKHRAKRARAVCEARARKRVRSARVTAEANRGRGK
jgi:hypothetical protein